MLLKGLGDEMTQFDTREPDLRSRSEETHQARLDAEALAGYRSGRLVPHERVVEWLKTWGTGNKQPRPKPEPR
jgi:hypothetical protein